MDTSNLNLDLVHIIGHGLGAHASGYTGKRIRYSRNTLVGRITGLDPAGPFFNGVSEAVRLDKSDASFVDIIHTNVDGKREEGKLLYRESTSYTPMWMESVRKVNCFTERK
ncbi:Pancreatic lipase-related protein 2, partial [Stegodyphus mimosarum]